MTESDFAFTDLPQYPRSSLNRCCLVLKLSLWQNIGGFLSLLRKCPLLTSFVFQLSRSAYYFRRYQKSTLGTVYFHLVSMRFVGPTSASAVSSTGINLIDYLRSVVSVCGRNNVTTAAQIMAHRVVIMSTCTYLSSLGFPLFSPTVR